MVLFRTYSVTFRFRKPSIDKLPAAGASSAMAREVEVLQKLTFPERVVVAKSIEVLPRN